MLNFLIIGLLLAGSPRQVETFKESLRSLMTPKAIGLTSVTRYTNSFSWTIIGNAPWQTPDGFRLYQYSLSGTTNTYETDKTNITIVYMWPDDVERWFYYVVATNEWGDSDPSKGRHIPLYPADRADLFAVGVSSFTLQSSADRKTWTSSSVNGRTTVMLTGPQRYFRIQGINNRLEIDEYNPLNQ